MRSPAATPTAAPRASARGLLLIALACAAGAGLVLVAAAQPWVVEVAVQPAPLPELRTARTGTDQYPWLPALAWVGLAGAGALLATGGMPRRLVGGLLLLVGAGLVAGAGTAAATSSTMPVWPVVAGLGGLVVAGAGGLAVLRAGRWPAMGARYDRRSLRPDGPRDQRGDQRQDGSPAAGEASPEALWEALDRGEDPTAR